MIEPILKVKNLNVKLKDEEIIKNLSFEVKKGDILTILGPNGAGKTVLLKTLIGIFPHREEEIEWQEGIKIGYVPQRLPFIREIPMTVEDFFKLKNVSSKEEIEKFLETLALEKNLLNKNIGKLSSGQFQKILIIWALIGNPHFLLFDEPTSGIDICGEKTIYNLLSKLNREKGLTILLVTHDLNVVFKFSNFVICLNKNSICQGIPKQVLNSEKLYELYGGGEKNEIKFYKHLKH